MCSCVCAYLYVYIYICIYICACVHIYVCMRVCMYINMKIYRCVCLRACACVCIHFAYVSMFMYVYIYTYMYIYMCIYMYIYMFEYTYMQIYTYMYICIYSNNFMNICEYMWKHICVHIYVFRRRFVCTPPKHYQAELYTCTHTWISQFRIFSHTHKDKYTQTWFVACARSECAAWTRRSSSSFSSWSFSLSRRAIRKSPLLFVSCSSVTKNRFCSAVNCFDSTNCVRMRACVYVCCIGTYVGISDTYIQTHTHECIHATTLAQIRRVCNKVCMHGRVCK